jgi:hypothetical protein
MKAPGYDRAVPLGRNTFRAGALIELSLVGFSLGYPKKRVSHVGAREDESRPSPSGSVHLRSESDRMHPGVSCAENVKIPCFHDPLFASRSKIIE